MDFSLYNLYNKNMNNYRLTFNTSNNITLPLTVYATLRKDAYEHGFIRNDKPNVSGFLNKLIPLLSDHQDILRQKVLKYADGNEDLTKFAEQCYQNVYRTPFDFHEDSFINVPFRINKEHYNDFLKIHDVKLSYYNTDFTNYVRCLLIDYASQIPGHRDKLFALSFSKELQYSMDNGYLCHFYCTDEIVSFFPISLERSPLNERLIVTGCTEDKAGVFIELSKIKAINVDRKKISISEAECERLWKSLMDYFDEILLNRYLNELEEKERIERLKCSD